MLPRACRSAASFAESADISPMDIEALKYPIGKPNIPKAVDQQQLNAWIDAIEALPQKLTALVEPLSEEQLATPYRPGGWTVRQTVNHLGDSHLNSYVRFKWALTEDQPTIKAYDQDAWSDLFDTREGDMTLALNFLTALHARWVYLLRGLTEEQWNRRFKHPESGRTFGLRKNVGLYVWHGEHHYRHIADLARREGWE